MKKTLVCSTAILVLATAVLAVARIDQVRQHLIPTGQLITPAGSHVEVNDRPLGMVLSPDGQTLIVCTGSNFAPRVIHLIDVKSKSATQTIPVAVAGTDCISPA